MKSYLKALGLGLLMVPLQEPHFSMTGPNGSVDITAHEITASTIGSGQIEAVGHAVIKSPGSGLMITGDKISATVERGADQTPFLKSAAVQGKAVLTYLEVPEQGQTADTNPLGQFTADSLTYDYTADEGHLHIADSFRGMWRDPANGPTVNLEGGRADFVLMPTAPSPDDKVSSGEIAGPVKVQIEAQDSADGAPIKVDGRGDRAVFKLTGSVRTISILGHVQINGNGMGYVGNASGEIAVITLGPRNQLKEIKLSGAPATATAQPASGGGR